MKPAAVVSLLFLFAACGGSPVDGDASPRDAGAGSALCSAESSRLLIDLTKDELGIFCDCVAAPYGGYGHSKSCDANTTVSSKDSQAACVASAAGVPASCGLTAGRMFSCAVELSQCTLNGLACQSITSCASTSGDSVAAVVTFSSSVSAPRQRAQ